MRRESTRSTGLCAWCARLLLLAAVAAPLLTAAPSAHAQDEDMVDRPISRVEIQGLARLTDDEIRPNLRVAPGQPYDPAAVRDDVATLYRLGQFGAVTAEASIQRDGTVAITYLVSEQELIAEVQVVGNKVLSDQELRAVIPLFRNAPRDDFLVQQAIRDIKGLYRKRGHYLADVDVDESRLETDGILIFKVVEGPRVKIKAIAFEGNESIPSGQLRSQIKTKQSFLLLRRGQLDEDLLIDDVATLDRYYRDRGFIDVRVDRRIDLSPDNREAKVTFVIAEGRQYRVREVVVEGFASTGARPLEVMAAEQVRALMLIRPGDVYLRPLLDASITSIRNAYLVMGYVDMEIVETSIRIGETPEIDLIISLREGRPTRAGLVLIRGNYLTKDKVIRREVRIQPGRTIDGRELIGARQRLVGTRLFGGDVRITLQQPSEEDPETRDVLVEIKEKNTGSVGFGAAFGSDSGVVGEISLRQDNFDIADPPQSINELIAGRAFRGAGQRFNLQLAPGNEVSTYSISLGDPRLFDSDFGGNVLAFWRNRDFSDYDEERINGTVSFSRRFGDVWSGAVSFAAERVELSDFNEFAPVEILDDAGPNNLYSVSLTLTRTTADRRFRPSRGSNLDLELSYTGGDREYPALSADYTLFLLIDEDFLGRRTVLRLNTQFSYIIADENEAPVYDKYYLGGRTFRGFEFRTVSPKGIDQFGNQTNTPVGGNWLFFAGAQVEFPVFQELLAGVVFVDSGTVQNDIGFDEYRVSVGAGLRIYLPQFGPAPIAVDFGFPLVQQELDEEQLVSFSADIPF